MPARKYDCALFCTVMRRFCKIEVTFCELRCKEVINVTDGKRLGHIIDMIIDTKNKKVLGIVVPALRRGFSLFKSCEDIFIPFDNICKIGDDVILVELYGDAVKGGKISESDSKSENQSGDTSGETQENVQECPNCSTYGGNLSKSVYKRGLL